MVDGAGRRLEVPTQFSGDDGSAPAVLADALEVYARDRAARSRVVDALARSRLLVPVVAVPDETESNATTPVDPTGLGAGKSSHMATVSLVQADGRRGLLAFTCVASMSAWDPGARPVPARGVDVAAAALEEGAQGVLLDIAGPIRFALDGEDLQRLGLSAQDR